MLPRTKPAEGRLIVSNFKGVPDGTYELPAGLVRLEGANGSGKSSFMMAVVWVLCGKVPRIRSYARRGTKVFSVTLEGWSGLKITRTNSPAKLVVVSAAGRTEDRKAEEVIAAHLGCDPSRAAWGILQTSTSSLVGLSPTDQYQVLSEISGVDLEDVKARLAQAQASVVSTTEEVARYRIDLAKYQEGQKKIRGELAVLPKGTPRPNADREVEKLESLLRDLETRLESLGSTDEATSYQTQLAALTKLKAPAAPESVPDDIRRDLGGYRLLVAALRAAEARDSHVESATAEREARIAAIEKKLRNVDPELRERVSDLRDEYREHAKKMMAYESLLQTKTAAQNQMKKVFVEAKEAFAADEVQAAKTPKTMIAALSDLRKTFLRVMDCPKCRCKLIETSGVLEVSVGSSRADAKKLARVDQLLASLHPQLVSDFHLKVSRPAEPSQNLEALEKKLAEYEALKGELRTLNIASDPVAKKLEVAASATRKAVEALGEDWVSELDAIDLTTAESYVEDLAADLEEATKTHARYEERMRTYRQARKQIPELRAKLQAVDSSSSPLELSRQITKTTEALAAAKAAVVTNSALARREELEAELAEAESNSQRLIAAITSGEEMLRGLTEVKKLIKTAALMSFERTLDAVNAIAAKHLDAFFSDPVQVKLTIPAGTKGKVSLEVFYRSQDATYEDFSGGETQKVRLAFFLAVSEVLGLKIMLIDEALSAIDEPSRPAVIEAFVNARHADLRMVVTHSSLEEGLFDAVLEL